MQLCHRGRGEADTGTEYDVDVAGGLGKALELTCGGRFEVAQPRLREGEAALRDILGGGLPSFDSPVQAASDITVLVGHAMTIRSNVVPPPATPAGSASP